MNNPLILDSTTASGRRFTTHLASFQTATGPALHQGIFSDDGYCSQCGITSPHHFDRITCSMCRRAYHTTCLLDSLGRGTVAAVVKNPSLWWFCLECLFVFNSSEVITPSAPISSSTPRLSGNCKPQVVPLPKHRPRKTRPVNPRVDQNGSAFEDELQARLTQMESQIYNRLKSDMCRSLSQLSLPQAGLDDDEEEGADSYEDESDLQSLEGIPVMDSGIGASRRRRNGDHFSDDDGIVHTREFSSSSGFSESQSSSNSFDKSKSMEPASSSTPKPEKNQTKSKSLSSSRHLSFTSCPQLNKLDDTADNDTPGEDSDTPKKKKRNTPPRATNHAPPRSSRDRSLRSGNNAVQESRSAVFTPPRPRPKGDQPNITPGSVPNEMRKRNNEDLSEIKKLISLSRGINYNNQSINKRK